MGKFSKFLSGRNGRRLLNLAYSWGACLVILGATFKIAHYPYDDVFLTIGMVTEIVMFFISGFDEPPRDYKWEKVFPQFLAGGGRVSGEDAERAGEAMRKMSENIEKINKAYEEEAKLLDDRIDRLREADTKQKEMNAHLEAIDEQYRRIMDVVCTPGKRGGK